MASARSHVDSMYSWYHVMKGALYLCGPPPKKTQPLSNHENSFRQIPILQNHLLKHARSSKIKSEELSHPREASGDMKTESSIL